MARRERRRFTGAEKTGIVKRHLVDRTAVSDLCEELGLQPTQFYQWQKQLFANGAKAFEHATNGPKQELLKPRSSFWKRSRCAATRHWPNFSIAVWNVAPAKRKN